MEYVQYRLYIIRVLHQTTTPSSLISSEPSLYIIRVLHQTTTQSRKWSGKEQLYIIRVLHQTTTPGMERVDFGCFTWLKSFVKSVPVRRRSRFDAFFRISKNEYSIYFSEKFKLLRGFGFGAFYFAPEVQDFSILFVRHAQHARISGRRHRFSYPVHMHEHVFFRGAMSDVNRILHHRKTVFLQCLAELGRMASFGFGLGREIEEYEQPHDSVGIQSGFGHYSSKG